jgi:hypothetical protein
MCSIHDLYYALPEKKGQISNVEFIPCAKCSILIGCFLGVRKTTVHTARNENVFKITLFPVKKQYKYVNMVSILHKIAYYFTFACVKTLFICR